MVSFDFEYDISFALALYIPSRSYVIPLRAFRPLNSCAVLKLCCLINAKTLNVYVVFRCRNNPLCKRAPQPTEVPSKGGVPKSERLPSE